MTDADELKQRSVAWMRANASPTLRERVMLAVAPQTTWDSLCDQLCAGRHAPPLLCLYMACEALTIAIQVTTTSADETRAQAWLAPTSGPAIGRVRLAWVEGSQKIFPCVPL